MLVNIDALKDVERELGKSFSYVGTDSGKVVCATVQDVAALLGDTTEDIHYVSDGSISTHELVAAMLHGKKNVHATIATFSFTEFPARTLAGWKADGTISKLDLLLDVRGKANYPDVMQLMGQVADRMRVVSIHAKVCILRGDGRYSILISSSNWTQNPRIETGMISNNSKLVNFHLHWINQLLEK